MTKKLEATMEKLAYVSEQHTEHTKELKELNKRNHVEVMTKFQFLEKAALPILKYMAIAILVLILGKGAVTALPLFFGLG